MRFEFITPTPEMGRIYIAWHTLEALRLTDPEATKRLFTTNVILDSPALIQHPTYVVNGDDDHPYLSQLGFVNGLIGMLCEPGYRIGAEFDDNGGLLRFFVAVNRALIGATAAEDQQRNIDRQASVVEAHSRRPV